MGIFQTKANPLSKITCHTSILWLTFAISSMKAQTYYALSQNCHDLYEVNVSSSNCECELTLIMNDFPCFVGYETFCPDGEFYAIGDTPPAIYTIDLSTGDYYLAYSFPPNVLPPINGAMRGLVCVGDGLFYFGWSTDISWTSTSLYRFNANSGTLTNLGVIPSRVYTDWAFYDGEIYAWDIGELFRIDTLNPENSEVICSTLPEFVSSHGLTASHFCHSLLGCNLYTDTLFNINLQDCSVRPLCHLATPLWWIISMAEFEPSPFCTGIIDLDCNNSSGAEDSDYNADPFNCLTEGGVHIADEDISIFIDDVISEMTIELIDPLPDAPEEVLIMSGFVSGIDVSGDGTTLITLTNVGGANIRDFEEALRLILYVDAKLYPTGGLRTVHVQFTTVAGTSSNVASAFINVEELSIIDVELGPDLVACNGEMVTFDAGHPGSFYEWSSGHQTQIISIGDEDTYMVTVSDGVNCPGIDTVELEIIPVIHVSLEGDTEGCDNEPDSLIISTDAPFPLTVEISSDPGGSFTFDDVIGQYHFADYPSDITEYAIVNVIPSEPGCVVITDPNQTVDIFPTYVQDVDMSICDGDSISMNGVWFSEAGTFEILFNSINQCDSLVFLTIEILPAINILTQQMTCDSQEVGTFITYLNNPNGCDTVLQNVVSLFPTDTVHIELTSCSASEVGVFIETITDAIGCDSVIVTSISWIPPTDTIQLLQTSCDSSLLGVFEQSLIAQDGCDSIVITTIEFGQADTSYLFTTSCDSSSLGIFEEHFISVSGCDSTVITTVTYSDNDETFINGSSCNPADAGVFIQSLFNRFGCDSIVTTTINFLPGSVNSIQTTTCDPVLAGVFVDTLSNQYGCDSVLTQTVLLLPESETFLTSNTCILSESGTFVNTFPNQYGCDSIVTLTVTHIPLETIVLNLKTCDPNLVGIAETVFTNQDGCDSIVIEETILYPLPLLEVIVNSDFNGYDISCFGENDGSALAMVFGISPWTYSWSTGSDNSSITGLVAGSYAITVTDGNGCQTSDIVSLVEPSPFSFTFMVSEPDCFAQHQGSITVIPSGGVGSYSYSIDGVNFQSFPHFDGLSGGVYEVIALDDNYCQVTEFIAINVPLPLNVNLGEDLTILLNDTTIIHAIVNIPIDSISAIVWTGLQNPDCPTCLTQAVAPIVTSSYSVTVTNVDGCSAEDSVTVHLQQDTEVYVPNVFSPNGDQINDRFLISAGDQLKEISFLLIYDRWGNLVFSKTDIQPNDPNHAWDGTYRNEPLNPAVFVYRVILEFNDGHTEVKTGSLTLLR